jgi:uncharacterized protein YcbK (DUF882 family)
VTLARWGEYVHFKKEEFDCKHTGENQMQHEFMLKLVTLRLRYAKPLRVTSGYRDVTHPAEARKSISGAHSHGVAVDLAVQGADAYRVLELATTLGFTGIGVQQKGDGRFIHLDTYTDYPRVWSY